MIMLFLYGNREMMHKMLLTNVMNFFHNKLKEFYLRNGMEVFRKT